MTDFSGAVCRAIACLLAYLLTAVPASADVNLQMSINSDYVYRGLSQTASGTGLQAVLHGQLDSGWFGGIGMNRVDYRRPSDERSVETNYFAGVHVRRNEDFAYSVALVYYDYNDDSPIDYDWREAQINFHLTDHWTATYAYSDDWYGLNDASHTAELIYVYALPKSFSTAITAGYSRINGVLIEDYAFADAKLAWSHGPLTMSLGYTITDDGANRLGSAADSRWLLSLAWQHKLY